ncbi:MAG TPA: hypothetical protein DCL10_07865, partial [Acidimicrobium sp.]|nr:hypothetical protein [Acidimicrobium sp.]
MGISGAPSKFETLLVTRDSGIVTVTMNRPSKKNAANATMWAELLAVFREVGNNEQDRAMVLTGAGEAFCSGADLGGGNSDSTPDPRVNQSRRSE